MIDGVLFDIDGTLLDHDAAAAAALRAAIARRPGSKRMTVADHEAIAHEWKRLEDLHYGEYLSGVTDLAGQRRRRTAGLLAHLGLPQREAGELDSWFAEYLADYRRAWVLFDDVLPAIESLAAGGFALGVITNADAETQRQKLAVLGIADRFTSFVASSELGLAKPDPGIFLAAVEASGIAAERLLYVGDRLDTDARGARDAGLTGVWINRDSSNAASEDVPTIRSLAELAAMTAL